MHSSTSTLTLTVGARCSPLSKVQVNEVLSELRAHSPQVKFHPLWLETKGDKDQLTSLRGLEKTDFFTSEIDQLLAGGIVEVAIHSAKDLPEPLHPKLCIAAITQGVDRSDSLVLPEGETIDSLPEGAVIATSSERREETVRQLRANFRFSDVRGTIGKRLALLENGRVDGVVIAEAALIRLGLTGLNRVTLPGDTTPLQGQLAVMVRSDRKDLIELFAPIDVR